MMGTLIADQPYLYTIKGALLISLSWDMSSQLSGSSHPQCLDV